MGATTSAIVTITEQGVPFLTISALSSSIKKGENAQFQVRSDYSTSQSRTINVGLVVNPTDLISNLDTRQVTIPANQYSGDLTIAVPRDSDSNFDTNGRISAFIVGHDVRTERVSSETTFYSTNSRSALVQVIDDDIISGISIFPEKERVFEGEIARFYIYASDITTDDRIINLSVSDGNTNRIDIYSTSYPFNTVTIPAGANLAQLEVRTLAKPDRHTGVSVTATLNPATPNLAATNNSASIVIDDKNVPTLSFTKSLVRVNEGQTFSMTITADQAPITNLPIQIRENFGQSSDFSFAPSNIVLNAGQRSTTVVVTSNPDVPEHSSYYLEIMGSSDLRYAVAENNYLRVIVYDTSSAPTVAISAVNSTVVEGQKAQFNITLSPATSGNAPTRAYVAVSFNKVGGNAFGNDVPVDENGDSIFPFTRYYNVSGSKTIEIATRSPDTIPDPESSITATIKLGSGGQLGNDRYKIATSPNNSATVAVTNETRPVLSISAVEHEISEGSDVEFAVSVVPPGNELEFAYQVSETGNFVIPEHLTPQTMTTSTASTTTLTVNTKDVNPQFEPDSLVTVQLILINNENFVFGPSTSATTLITDANTPVGGLSLVAINNSITEGEPAKYQIRTTRRLTQAVEVNVGFTNNTVGRNFIASENLTQRINFGADQRSVNFSVPTVDLDNFGLPSTITATLQANGNQYRIAPGKSQQTTTVYSNDVELTASVSVYKTFVAKGSTEPTIIRETGLGRLEVTEGNEESIVFEISLTHPTNSYTFPPRGIEVDYTITQTGGDFIADAGNSITSYSSGVQKSSTFRSLGTNLVFLNTQIDDGNTDGSITLTIDNDDSSPVRYVVNNNSENSSKTVAVNNEFGGTLSQLSLSPTNIEGTSMPVTTVSEGDIWGVKVSIDPPASFPFNVVISATETGDFLLQDSESEYVRAIPIAIGESEKWFYGGIDTDDVDDPNGTLTVQLVERAYYTIDTTNNEVTYAFKDVDDQIPTLTLSSQSVAVNENVPANEGETSGKMVFGVELSHASVSPIIVNYTIASTGLTNPATSISDYTSTNNSITIPTGETTGTIELAIVNDAEDESNENLILTINRPNDALYKLAGDASSITAHGTIIDDDSVTLPVISIGNVEVDEDIESGLMTFTVTLSKATTSAVNLTYSTTTSGTATEGTDFTAVSSDSFSISAGSTSVPITVSITADAIDEYHETIGVKLSLTSSNAQFVGGETTLTAIGTIRDDDRKPQLTFENTTVSNVETNGTASFTVNVVDPLTKLGTTSGKPISVKYSAQNGTATSGTDFMLTPATLNIAAGSPNGTITVTLVDTTSSVAINKDYSIQLTEPSNARFSGQSHLVAQGIIVDKNAVTPELSIADAPVTVAGNDASF